MHDREDCMSFNIRGTIVTFSKVEFLLMTGFWSSINVVDRSTTEGNRLWDRYFPTRGRLTIFYLEKEYPKLEFDNDDDGVKVSLVYYTESTMMGKDKHMSVDLSLFVNVNDVRHFNSMDWRSILWERTLQGLHWTLVGKARMYRTIK